jgi:hypothetical protein
MRVHSSCSASRGMPAQKLLLRCRNAASTEASCLLRSKGLHARCTMSVVRRSSLSTASYCTSQCLLLLQNGQHSLQLHRHILKVKPSSCATWSSCSTSPRDEPACQYTLECWQALACSSSD